LKVIWLPPRTTSRDKEALSDASQPLIASASSDTLVKLWSPYSPTDSDHLLTTLDNHSDRVWALTSPSPAISQPTKSEVNGSTRSTSYPLISGAADASLTFWADTSIQTASLASKRATERIEQDQLLQNHIFTKNYREAIILSLALNHPGRLLRVFQDVVNLPDSEKDRGSIMGVQAVDDVLAALDHQQLFTLLERVRDWNTNARTSTAAQRILNCLFKNYPASTFVDMAKERRFGGADKGMKEILRALEVYTERHYRRIEELVDESYLIEYTLREMDELAGTAFGVTERDSQDVVMV
jgi:U3 small nucleolar RNA-associated protein 13